MLDAAATSDDVYAASVELRAQSPEFSEYSGRLTS
jgi:hypothetical protein